MRVFADKIASVTRNLKLDHQLTLTREVRAEHGAVIAGRVLREKSTYNTLEDRFGRMVTVQAGDVVVGALGHRNALHGYEGVLPASVVAGQTLHLLNLGGVIGECVSHNPDVGRPFELEVLGQVLTFPDIGSRAGVPANASMGALAAGGALPRVPVIFVMGTCMNSGKTAASCVLVRRLRQEGFRVGGVKLTGVSLMRDTLSMRDYGAVTTADFTDAGVVCTAPGAGVVETSRRIFAAVGQRGVDVIVAETGDGIMGEYGVQDILADPGLRGLGTVFLFCANDPVGVAGGVSHLKSTYGIQVDLVTGPATDNRVGQRFVEREVGVVAHNARTEPDKVAERVIALLRERKAA
jgi:hypothetical protein